jgi:hypothetical protein
LLASVESLKFFVGHERQKQILRLTAPNLQPRRRRPVCWGPGTEKRLGPRLLRMTASFCNQTLDTGLHYYNRPTANNSVSLRTRNPLCMMMLSQKNGIPGGLNQSIYHSPSLLCSDCLHGLRAGQDPSRRMAHSHRDASLRPRHRAR